VRFSEDVKAWGKDVVTHPVKMDKTAAEDGAPSILEAPILEERESCGILNS
jgi:hypothetical protein